MPDVGRFTGTDTSTATEGLYSTLLHEGIHATGHKSRLDRDFSKKFGVQERSREELCAELGAAFLCADLGVTQHLRLGVNIDHVATVRNARGCGYPDPVRAALLAAEAGADGITAHLREDRRHITDDDIARLSEQLTIPLNLEMAATEEMLRIALDVRPDFCTLVPEKRAERTTEGGLDVRGGGLLELVVTTLRSAGIGVSLFIDPDPEVVARASGLGASTVELHTGYYCDAVSRSPDSVRQLSRLQTAALAAADRGLRLGAGHGLDHANVGHVAALPHLEELNIGHGLVARAVMVGLDRAVAELCAAIQRGAEAARGR